MSRKKIKIIKYHKYKIHELQELIENNFNRRVEFCVTLMKKIDQDLHFFFNIVFSIEASCELLEPHTQEHQKLNVLRSIGWAIFHDLNLDGDRYDFWENILFQQRNNIAGDHIIKVWLERSRIPAYYRTTVRNYMKRTFSNRWIDRRGWMKWASSSDLDICAQLSTELRRIADNNFYNL